MKRVPKGERPARSEMGIPEDAYLLVNDENEESKDGYRRRVELPAAHEGMRFWKSLAQYPECSLVLPVDTHEVELPVNACPPTIVSVETFEDFAVDKTFIPSLLCIHLLQVSVMYNIYKGTEISI